MAMNVSCLYSNLKNPAQCNSPLDYINMVDGKLMGLNLDEKKSSFSCNCVLFLTAVKNLKKLIHSEDYLFPIKLMGEKTLRKTLTWTCLRSHMQDFREKNTDHMRPDIVALLKSSKNAFVCGLMGIDPTATFRWSVLRSYFRALVAFREAGRRHRQKKTGELAEEKVGTDRWRLRRGIQPYFVFRVLIRSSTEGSAKGKKKRKNHDD